MTSGAWKPLLDGEDATRTRAVVSKLGEATWFEDGRTGLEHDVGLVLLRLEQRPPKAEIARLVEALLARPFERLALADGLAGAVFVAEVGARLGALSDDPAEGFEDVVVEHLERLGSAELFYGVAGLLLTALERQHRPRGPELIERLVARIEAMALTTEAGLTWASCVGDHQTGLAHGVSAIAALLADAASAGFPRARPLADAAFAHLESLRLPEERSHVFPAEPARSQPMFAFCHGDVGIAVGLARAPGDAAARIAAATRVAALARARPGLVGQFDRINLCHGTTGAAQLICRLVRGTADEDVLDAARTLLRNTVAHLEAVPFQRCAFEYASPGEFDRPTAGLYDGAAGVALVLQSACAPTEPLWDRLLLFRRPLAQP